VLDTPISDKYLKDGGAMPVGAEWDDIELPANFFVWLASPESEFLRGRFLWANWDVEEMVAKKEELEKDQQLLRIQIGGWPFA